MKRIRRITAGSLVGMALVAGIAGTASAAPASTATTGAGISTTTTSNAPPTGSPFTSTPATPSPSGSTPPATTTPSVKPKKSKKKDVLTGAEIWAIVSSHHAISCAHATKELKRLRGADAAITQRLGRWSTRAAAVQKSTATKAKAMVSTTGKKVKFFRKLEKKGTTLIKRIDAQSATKTPAG